MGLGGRPTSTDGFILGPSHGTVGRLAFLRDCAVLTARVVNSCAPPLLNLVCNLVLLRRI